jgi:hypothetical protein
MGRYKEFDVVKAKVSLSKNVKRGTKGAIVMVYDSTHYEVEFMDKEGNTLDVLTVEDASLE